jgi:DNA-binding CsgD family transcriptional regulator
VVLSDEDRAALGPLLGSGDRRLTERERIILACAASDAGNSGVAATLGLSVETARMWRSRFAKSGPVGLVLTDAERDPVGHVAAAR